MKRTSILFTLILALALVAGACSDNGESSQIASLETDTADTSNEAETDDVDPLVETEAAMLDFAQCLREQGFEVGDPTVDADGNVQLPPIEFTSEVSGGDPEEGMADINKAMTSCEEHLEGVVMTGNSSSASGFEDTLLEYTQCMRANGYDMPDPDLSGGGGMIDLGSGEGEEFEAADAECRHLLADLGISES
ncbi:MAG: hypothetical protein U9N78_06070 [Actinomycetota bacterium]|nr:hypothetical protein [Actinomycetota bacterium]